MHGCWKARSLAGSDCCPLLLGFMYYEVSAKTGKGVLECMDALACRAAQLLSP